MRTVPRSQRTYFSSYKSIKRAKASVLISFRIVICCFVAVLNTCYRKLADDDAEGKSTLILSPTSSLPNQATLQFQLVIVRKDHCCTTHIKLSSDHLHLSFLSSPWGLGSPVHSLLSFSFLCPGALLRLLLPSSLVLACGIPVWSHRYTLLVAFNPRL